MLVPTRSRTSGADEHSLFSRRRDGFVGKPTHGPRHPTLRADDAPLLAGQAPVALPLYTKGPSGGGRGAGGPMGRRGTGALPGCHTWPERPRLHDARECAELCPVLEWITALLRSHIPQPLLENPLHHR